MAEHPTIDGIHHVTLSVSDLDRSVRWYTDVLGFAEKRRVEVNGMTKAMLTRDELLITLTEHGEFAEPGPFNERHAGLDHLVAYARMSEVTGSDHYKKGPVVWPSQAGPLSSSSCLTDPHRPGSGRLRHKTRPTRVTDRTARRPSCGLQPTSRQRLVDNG
jgi:catechol 2,3-dioxygenase-like lactoylglutathione lyase family enzyme